jgi:hypothetical protein
MSQQPRPGYQGGALPLGGVLLVAVEVLPCWVAAPHWWRAC